MFTIESKFIGDFKIGDNINHNLGILALLYRLYNAAPQEEKRLLCKPIILLLVSIIDAALYDLHTRIKKFTAEGVRHVLKSSVITIRALKKMDTLEKHIKSLNEHGLIEPRGGSIYTELDELRKLRNRIHIQNTKNHLPRNEYDAFTEERKLQAEKAVEKTLRIMAKKYTRKFDLVNKFTLPWNAHFSD